MREKFYRFMQGRYGVDQLYRFIFFLALVLMIINIFLRNPMLNLVIYALLILDIFRGTLCSAGDLANNLVDILR